MALACCRPVSLAILLFYCGSLNSGASTSTQPKSHPSRLALRKGGPLPAGNNWLNWTQLAPIATTETKCGQPPTGATRFRANGSFLTLVVETLRCYFCSAVMPGPNSKRANLHDDVEPPTVQYSNKMRDRWYPSSYLETVQGGSKPSRCPQL
jgi:hypothetical protein